MSPDIAMARPVCSCRLLFAKLQVFPAHRGLPQERPVANPQHSFARVCFDVHPKPSTLLSSFLHFSALTFSCTDIRMTGYESCSAWRGIIFMPRARSFNVFRWSRGWKTNPSPVLAPPIKVHNCPHLLSSFVQSCFALPSIHRVAEVAPNC